jgi:hypothetical protein
VVDEIWRTDGMPVGFEVAALRVSARQSRVDATTATSAADCCGL